MDAKVIIPFGWMSKDAKLILAFNFKSKRPADEKR